MKKYSFIPLLFLAALAVFSLGSCQEEDPCEEVVCQNQGVCDNGNCDCPEPFYGTLCEDKCVNGDYENGACSCNRGYEGESCETIMRTKYLGSWSVEETCSIPAGFTDSYTSGVSEDPDNILGIIVSNFRGQTNGAAIKVTVDQNDSDKLIIEEQLWETFTLTGDGNINSTGDTITLNYRAVKENGTEECTLKLF